MSLLDIGLSGINSARTRLETAGHNIANVSVPGFSRRETTQSSVELNPGEQQVMLAGTRIDDIRRVTRDFLVDQRHVTAADYGDAREYGDYQKRLDAYIGNEHTGMTSSIERYTSALSAAAIEPASAAYRQQIISEASAMSVKFNNLGRALMDFSRQVEDQLRAIADEASSLAGSVASLNETIRDEVSRGAQVADLRDQRDRLINSLSELVGVDSVRQTDGMISLVFRSGQPLVIGEHSYSLVMPNDEPNAFQRSPLLDNGITLEPLQANSGELHGLERFRSEVLLPTLNMLGWQSVVNAAGNNRILAEGVDLQGMSGAPLFRDVNAAGSGRERVLPEQVSGTAVLSLLIDPEQLTELQVSEYALQVLEDNGGLIYSIRRVSDDQVVSTGPVDVAVTTGSVFDGLVLGITPGLKSGDRYLLTPWRNETASIRTVLSDPDQLGLASPAPSSGRRPGDNSNITNLTAFMQSETFSVGTLPESSDRLLGSIATRSWQASQQAESLALLKRSADAGWEQLSGVDLDEEAGDLIRFQQQYQANARVLAAAQKVIDTLLSI